jgi:hypothetical protein
MATYQTDTSSYKLNHTMLRVKNPVESCKFALSCLALPFYQLRRYDNCVSETEG